MVQGTPTPLSPSPHHWVHRPQLPHPPHRCDASHLNLAHVCRATVGPSPPPWPIARLPIRTNLFVCPTPPRYPPDHMCPILCSTSAARTRPLAGSAPSPLRVSYRWRVSYRRRVPTPWFVQPRTATRRRTAPATSSASFIARPAPPETTRCWLSLMTSAPCPPALVASPSPSPRRRPPDTSARKPASLGSPSSPYTGASVRKASAGRGAVLCGTFSANGGMM